MNILKIISLGYTIVGAIASLEAGQPSPPVKIGANWYSLTQVPAPK